MIQKILMYDPTNLKANNLLIHLLYVKASITNNFSNYETSNLYLNNLIDNKKFKPNEEMKYIQFLCENLINMKKYNELKSIFKRFENNNEIKVYSIIISYLNNEEFNKIHEMFLNSFENNDKNIYLIKTMIKIYSIENYYDICEKLLFHLLDITKNDFYQNFISNILISNFYLKFGQFKKSIKFIDNSLKFNQDSPILHFLKGNFFFISFFK
jgi:tetratricopeptide (TPR) repeat protein